MYFVLLPPLAAATPFMGLSDDSLMAQLMTITAYTIEACMSAYTHAQTKC